MIITVDPDPDYPLGGHALIVVRGPVTEGPVSVSVTDLFEDRHLGPKGWQSAYVTLGPYPAREEAEATVVPVGPEIVDYIEEFATLRLTVAGVSAELAWPETIRTSPSKVGLGGMGVLSGSAPLKPATPKPKAPEPASQPTQEKSEMAPSQAAASPPTEAMVKAATQPRRSPLLLILAALALFAVIGGGLWWWLQGQVNIAPLQQAIAPAPEPEQTDPQPPFPMLAGCDAAGLAAAAALPPAEGFAAIARCGAEGDPEARFRVIEAAAATGVGEAIAMIGRWYDPAEAASVGSNFTSRDPAQSARYYTDAIAAGYANAAQLLRRACGELTPDVDPTHELARDLYCANP